MKQRNSIFCMTAIILFNVPLGCAAGVAAGTYDYAGTHHNSGAKENDWNTAASWANGPGDFPDATGDTARTAANVAGDVWLYLNEDITVGTFRWQGNQVYLYPGSPEGTLTVATGGSPAFWPVSTTYRFKIYADMNLVSDLVISNTNSREAELDGIISGPGKLILVWNQGQINDGYEFFLGEVGEGPNSYSGGTELQAVNGGMRGEFRARKNGVFGSGDVIVRPKTTLILNDIGMTDDMIADSAAVRLNNDSGNYAVMQLGGGVAETVGALYINGEKQYAGTYGASGSGAETILDNNFSGSGILTVLTGSLSPGEVRTTAATGISTNGATLNGIVDITNASPTYVFMHWGTSDAGMDWEAWEHTEALGMGGPGSFLKTISGRIPLEKLYYRGCISNSLGIKWASPSALVKLHGQPEIENSLPILRRDFVALRGTLSATNGFPTMVTVYWGTTDGGSSAAAWQSSAALGYAGPGLITTNIYGLEEDARYYYRFYAENAAGKAWAAESETFTAPGEHTFNDITFFSVSDCHYGATYEENALMRAGIDRMNTLPGTAYPAGAGGGIVDVPRGVLALGDLINDGANTTLQKLQWTQWTNDFGVNGECRVKYPVYEGFGNHDLNANLFIQDQIKARTQERIELTAISSNGYHYSWDWDRVHFLQLNLFPGDVHETPNYGPVHDPQYALAFLKQDLATHVGDSGRPVVIGQHYDPRDNWWTENQKSNFYNAITNYNVICIIHGHTGTGIYTWRGLDVVNDGNLGASVFVFHITTNRLHVAQYRSDNTWGSTLTKPISLPPIPEPALIGLSIAGMLYFTRKRIINEKKLPKAVY